MQQDGCTLPWSSCPPIGLSCAVSSCGPCTRRFQRRGLVRTGVPGGSRPPLPTHCPFIDIRNGRLNPTLLEAFSASQPAIARKATTKKRPRGDNVIGKEVENAVEDVGYV